MELMLTDTGLMAAESVLLKLMPFEEAYERRAAMPTAPPRLVLGARLEEGDWIADEVVDEDDEADRREKDVRRFMPLSRAVMEWKRDDCMLTFCFVADWTRE